MEDKCSLVCIPSFLGELTFVTAFILQCNNAGFYILVLSVVFKETQYFILMEHPQN